MTLAELAVKINVDQKELVAALNSAQERTKKTASSFENLGTTIVAAFSVGVVLNFIKTLTTAASNAQETAQRFSSVYGGIKKQAQEAADELAKGYNVSDRAAQEYLASTGDILLSMGMEQKAALNLSLKLNELAADRVSATNYAGGMEAASKAITSALLGEREALKGLGIAISEEELKQYAATQGKVWSQIDASTKAQITYELILKKSATSIGDVAKSVGTFAYETRNLDKEWENFTVALGSSTTGVFAGLKSLAADLLRDLTQVITQVTTLFAQNEAGAKARLDLAIKARDSAELIFGKNSAQYAINAKSVEIAQKTLTEAAAAGKVSGGKTTAGKPAGSPLTGGAGKAVVEEEVIAYEQGLSVFEQIRRSAMEYEGQINRNKTSTEQWAETMKKVETITNGINQALSAGAQLASAITAKRIQENDDEMNRELERRGLLEADEIAKAEQALAKAKESGDAERIRLAQQALDRAKIEEKYAKKKRQLEYEGAVTAWSFQMAQATATLPLMIMNAWNSGLQAGPFAGIPLATAMAGIATAAGLMQIAAITIAKPQKPKFAMGGIVPGDSFYGDRVAAQVNSGEMVLNREQQANLFSMANGSGGGLMRIAPISRESMFDVLFRASQSGELFISERAVVAR